MKPCPVEGSAVITHYLTFNLNLKNFYLALLCLFGGFNMESTALQKYML